MRLHPPCNGWRKTPLFTHLKQRFAAKKEGNPPLSGGSAAGRGEPSFVSALFIKFPDHCRVKMGFPCLSLARAAGEYLLIFVQWHAGSDVFKSLFV